MTSKSTTGASSSPARQERLAKALRDNLARRKALVRSKRERASADGAASPEQPGNAGRDDTAS